VAESQKNELTVSESVVDRTSSANHGQNTNKEILTFVGQYSDQKKVFADPEEEKCEYDIALARTIGLHSRIAWEKERKASGHLEFQGTGFAANDEAKFNATRKEGSKDTYEVTISFTSTLIVGGNQPSVSAEVRNFVLSFRPP
jgi:hypothetical protein